LPLPNHRSGLPAFQDATFPDHNVRAIALVHHGPKPEHPLSFFSTAGRHSLPVMRRSYIPE